MVCLNGPLVIQLGVAADPSLVWSMNRQKPTKS
ncbi:MAG: hypothetical protein JWQ95_119 [Sphaerisporangium sp.]|nr:hypothetical protein [Sphaerisporangium sp.]